MRNSNIANMKVEERYIWLKGEVVNVKDAHINVLSPSAQFGLNVFEGISCYWNERDKQLYAFRLSDHYDRLLDSARLAQMAVNYTKEDLKQAFLDVIRANNYREDIIVRQTLFVDGFGSWYSDGPVGMFVAPIPRKAITHKDSDLSCCFSSWRRISENTMSPRIKCGANYINSRVGQREAVRNGYDMCIFLNEKGSVSEGPGCCFFMVKDNTIITPRLTDSVLKSITRDTVIGIAREVLGLSVEEREIDRTEVYSADEVFLCGSSMEIRGVQSVDGYVYRDGVSKSVTGALQEKYSQIVRGSISQIMNWSTPIY